MGGTMQESEYAKPWGYGSNSRFNMHKLTAGASDYRQVTQVENDDLDTVLSREALGKGNDTTVTATVQVSKPNSPKPNMEMKLKMEVNNRILIVDRGADNI